LPDELDGYAMTKSSLHFPVDRPLAKKLVKRLIARCASRKLFAARVSRRSLGRLGGRGKAVSVQLEASEAICVALDAADEFGGIELSNRLRT
jgi:DNA-binding Xre family transcriptional regulator